MLQKSIVILVLLSVFFTGVNACADSRGNTISLAGTWRFALDPDSKGVDEKWFAKQLDDKVVLPGTTDENQKGIKKDERRDDRLSRVYYWKGCAWYQRQVVIPESWRGKHVQLLLERTKHSDVWIDDAHCGTQDSLSTPHIYDIGNRLTPGKHTLTILVDNSKLPPVGAAHAFDERTQTNWNGIVGLIRLSAADPVRVGAIQVYPDIKDYKARIRCVVTNDTSQPIRAVIKARAETWNTAKALTFESRTVPVKAAGPETIIEFDYPLGKGAPLWDEFHPAMIRLTISLEAHQQTKHFADTRMVDFGLRSFSTKRNQFTINGRPTFLRGKNDACIFPLTGYPPMDKAGWLKVLRIAKSYGINHYRFHSWCPPDAAFQAADELGIYLQPELPNKATSFNKPEHGGYLRREGELIFKTYGNHPSFVMFTLGNELGRNQAMFDMIEYFKQTDPRHLYAQGSNNLHWRPKRAEGDDFWVTCKTGKEHPVRGSFFQADYATPHIEHRPPSTMVDFSESIAGVPVPVVGHETGQFQVFPDFTEIPKYTGVLKARNLEVFRQRLADKNMLDQANEFVRASGALSILCYREDIETALRTPGFGGFQLLDLQDFPGQGTALVGILNAFMESKGLTTPESWRRFCCETVPLLRMKKYVWTNDEMFIGRVQVAHYGPADLPDMQLTWKVTTPSKHIVAAGQFESVTIKQGSVFDVDMFCFSLEKVQTPQKLTIEIRIEDTEFSNLYEFWVYSPKVDTAAPPGITIVRQFNESMEESLRAGAKVLLVPELQSLEYSIKGAFQSDFWCFPMFRRGAERRGIEAAPGTLGILCDPRCAALAHFPTEFHSNWQWWHLVKHSRPLILDDAPAAYRPMVQVIDNFERNQKLALLFETRLGAGKLIVCTIDLVRLNDRPEARQFLYSLLQYMDSNAFAPKTELNIALLRKLLTPALESKSRANR